MRLIPELAVILIAAGGFLWIYWQYPYHPTRPNNGWWNFFDQNQYLRSARALARGNWSPQEHVYPIGYPSLATPFIRMLPRDPFMPVNLTLFVAFAWASIRLFRPTLGIAAAAIAVFGALWWPTRIDTPLFVPHPIWSQFIVPWTTTGVAPLYLGSLLALRANWSKARPAVDLLIGLLLGAVVCVRPADAVPLGLAVAVYVVHTTWTRRTVLTAAIIFAGALLGASPFLVFMSRVYEGGVSPYMRNWRTLGFTFSNLHERAFQVLLRSEDTYGESRSALFELQPWLYVALPLAIVWAAAEPVVGGLLLGLIFSSWALYLAYNDFSPFRMLRFGLVHYLVWTLPLLAAAGIAGAVDIFRRRRWSAAAAVVLVAALAAMLRMAPVPVEMTAVEVGTAPCCRYTLSMSTAADLDAIDVLDIAVPGENQITLYTKDLALDAEGIRLASGSEYQVLQRAGGIRIMFNRNVTARKIAFTLDNAFTPLAQPIRSVQPIRFRATLARPR